MEYLKREPLKSAPAPETTAFTMKSIQELLAESGNEHLLQQANSAAAQTAPQPEMPPVPETAVAPATPPMPQTAAPRAAPPAPAPEPAAVAPAVQQPPRFPELTPAEPAQARPTAMPGSSAERNRKSSFGQLVDAILFGRG